jgi:hypothetical protein
MCVGANPAVGPIVRFFPLRLPQGLNGLEFTKPNPILYTNDEILFRLCPKINIGIQMESVYLTLPMTLFALSLYNSFPRHMINCELQVDRR